MSQSDSSSPNSLTSLSTFTLSEKETSLTTTKLTSKTSPYSSTVNTELTPNTTHSVIVIPAKHDTFTQDVIGSVLGSIAAVVILSFTSYYLYKRFKKPNKVSSPTETTLEMKNA